MYRSPPKFMKVVPLRELHRATGAVVKRLEDGGEPFVVTKHGRPVAMLLPVAQDAPRTPMVSLAPPADVPTGIQLLVFRVMDDTMKTAERLGRQLDLPWQEVGLALTRLELNGLVTRAVMGYVLSKKGVALMEWMARTEEADRASED